MDESYKDLIRSSSNYKQERDDKFKQSSRERLLKIASKKIKTTMIGALSTIESQFGFLWGHESGESLTPEQEHMRSLYEEIRSEILDKGNTQIRNLEAELAHYDISWLRYHISIPFKPSNKSTTGEGEEDNG